MKKYLAIFGLASLLGGCDGFVRGCSSMWAGAAGADWLVVQYDNQMRPANCWTERGTSMVNEEHSDGIYWLSDDGHLIHVGGWYNRVQVDNNDWDSAAKAVGVDLDHCLDGRYQND